MNARITNLSCHGSQAGKIFVLAASLAPSHYRVPTHRSVEQTAERPCVIGISIAFHKKQIPLSLPLLSRSLSSSPFLSRTHSFARSIYREGDVMLHVRQRRSLYNLGRLTAVMYLSLKMQEFMDEACNLTNKNVFFLVQ